MKSTFPRTDTWQRDGGEAFLRALQALELALRDIERATRVGQDLGIQGCRHVEAVHARPPPALQLPPAAISLAAGGGIVDPDTPASLILGGHDAGAPTPI